MRDDSSNLKQWLILGVICGIAANIAFTLATQVSINPIVNLLLFFSFGPFLITAIIGLYKLLSLKGNTIAIQLGTLFIILSGVTHTIMATMQGSIGVVMRGYISGAENETQKEMYKAIYRSVFSTQLGVDMAFDIFISLGVIMLAYSMWSHPRFGKIVSVLGIVIAATGLLFNIIAFPENAANVGLVDPGPFFGLWFLIVVIQVAISIKRVLNNTV
jgi:hypothetical protein